jgi:hypothetical protein
MLEYEFMVFNATFNNISVISKIFYIVTLLKVKFIQDSASYKFRLRHV